MRGVEPKGKLIRGLRTARGWTQGQLAASANCDAKTIRKAEKGERIEVASLRQIAHALDTEYAKLLRKSTRQVVEVVNLRVVKNWMDCFSKREVDPLVKSLAEQVTTKLPALRELNTEMKEIHGREKHRELFDRLFRRSVSYVINFEIASSPGVVVVVGSLRCIGHDQFIAETRLALEIRLLESEIASIVGYVHDCRSGAGISPL